MSAATKTADEPTARLALKHSPAANRVHELAAGADDCEQACTHRFLIK
jgi:hypothetical protein